MAAEASGRIGPFRLVRTLGAGGMGTVFLAASPSGRGVAVKVIRAEHAADPDFRRRFGAEVEAARRVSGAFTASVVDADPDAPLPWLATEYVAGPSLQDAIDEHGPMPAGSLRVLAAGLAEALAAIHTAGLVHRDLKPANILLAADGPRVIDFGISKPIEAALPTEGGNIVGSAGYMSPEHSSGLQLTAASDVFSLGAVLAFAATGRPPFGTGPLHLRVYRSRHEAPELDGVPSILLPLVAACLEKDPAARPTLAQLPGLLPAPTDERHWLGAVADDVTALERGMTEDLRVPFLKRRSVLFGGAFLGAAAVSGAAAWTLRPQTPTLRLKWSATLPRAGMNVVGYGPKTVICADQHGAATFDRAGGAPLWADTSGQAIAASGDADRVYTVRQDGRLVGSDARSGGRLWTVDAQAKTGVNLVPVAPDSLVTWEKGGMITIVDPVSGTVRGKADLRTAPGPLASVDDVGSDGSGTLVAEVVAAVAAGTLLVAYADLNAIGTSPGSGGSTEQFDFVGLSLADGGKRWSRSASEVFLPPTGEQAYTIDAGASLSAFHTATGQPTGMRAVPLPNAGSTNDYAASLSLSNGILLCQPASVGTTLTASNPVTTTAFDAADGSILWHADIRTNLIEHGFAVSGQALCYSDAGLHAVGARTGVPLWTAGGQAPSATWQIVGVADGAFLAATYGAAPGQGGLYAFDAGSGRQIWRQPFDNGSVLWSFQRPPGGLFAAAAGRLFAFEVPNSEW